MKPDVVVCAGQTSTPDQLQAEQQQQDQQQQLPFAAPPGFGAFGAFGAPVADRGWQHGDVLIFKLEVGQLSMRHRGQTSTIPTDGPVSQVDSS
jgi:hypothetical protein